MAPDGVIGITVLGATGSIGRSTLDVLARHRGRYRIVALTANTQVDVLYQQCLDYRPRYAVMADAVAAERLETKLRAVAPEVTVLSGLKGLEQVAAAPEADYVMAAIVGAAGVAAGADGIFMEVHDRPQKALSDGSTALELGSFAPLARRLRDLGSFVQKLR